MWVFYLFVIGVALIAIGKAIPKSKTDNSTKTREDYFLDDDEFYDEDYVPWDTHKFGNNRPDGDWVNLPKFSSRTNVSGTAFRKNDANAFLKGAIASDTSNQPFGVKLLRDPTNTHDRNAVKVVGHLAGGNPTNGRHIGFLDKDIAKHLADTYRSGMPVSAENLEAGTKDGALFFKINVLVPPAKSRKEFTLN